VRCVDCAVGMVRVRVKQPRTAAVTFVGLFSLLFLTCPRRRHVRCQERPNANGVIVATYSMIGHSGARATETQQLLDFIKSNKVL